MSDEDYYEKLFEQGLSRLLKLWAAMAVGIVVCALLSSCRTQEHVTVATEHRTDTLRQILWQHDSVHVHDSVMLQVRGDTVFRDVWHREYVTRAVHDTIFRSRTDSVPVPYPVPVEVERELTWWQQTRIHIGNIVIVLLMGAVAFFFARVIYNSRRHNTPL